MAPYNENFLSFLSNQNATFLIPPYQRSYEWDIEQCEAFLSDIIKTAKQNTGHFFGVITYFVEEGDDASRIFSAPKRLVLIDGQQRITTTLLFLMAFRDVCGDSAVKENIEKQYLRNDRAAGDEKYKVKLKQAEADMDVFESLVLSSPISAEIRVSSLYRNYMYFCGKLKSLAESGEDINAFAGAGLGKFNIIAIELFPEKNPWENPQDIFESMNSLGKPLSFADLVRNYLLLGLDSKQQETLYHKYWLPMEKSFPDKISDFLRDYMQTKEMTMFPKATSGNAKALYASFKKCFEGQNTESLMEDIAYYAELYSVVTGISSSGNPGIDKALSDIRLSGSGTAVSFCMFLLNEWKGEKLTTDETEEILRTLFVFFMRRRICGLGGAENKIMPTLPKYIGYIERAKDKTRAAFDVLSSHENSFRLPNDIELSKSLSGMNFYNFRYARFLFALIEECLTKSRPDITDKSLTIEHIMPQTLNGEWAEMLGFETRETYDAYIHTIGNLTLIRHNSELGNKSFDEKKRIYEEKAGLQIARTCITDCDAWNAKAIDRRTDWLIHVILYNILPIPDERRHINNFSAKETRGLSFLELQLVGKTICFAKDPSITAIVTGDKTVLFDGKEWKLSPLTRELMERRGECNLSGSYQGAVYWEYNGTRLLDMF